MGVCSYLLVHFWYTRVAAVKSALNAMFTNRVGDYFLTVGFFALFYTFMTLDYALIFSLAHDINPNVITFIAILLLLGAAAKSAQLGQVKAINNINKNLFILLINLIYAGKFFNSWRWYAKLLYCYFFNFDSSLKIKNNQQETTKLNNLLINDWNKEFLNWFIGFSEGDGSFYVTNNKIIFSIHLHIADLSLLYEIQTSLNMGVVYEHKKIKFCLLYG